MIKSLPKPEGSADDRTDAVFLALMGHFNTLSPKIFKGKKSAAFDESLGDLLMDAATEAGRTDLLAPAPRIAVGNYGKTIFEQDTTKTKTPDKKQRTLDDVAKDMGITKAELLKRIQTRK